MTLKNIINSEGIDIMKKKIFTKEWVKAAAVRALKTTAQAALGAIGATAMITDVNFLLIVSTAAMAGICSILTSVAGLPEVSQTDE